MKVSVAFFALAMAVGLGCAAPSAPRGGEQPATGSQPAASAPSGTRTLTLVVRYEVTDLAPKIVAGGPSQATKRAFNASLAMIDGAGAAQPYLAEALPHLNTDSWKVSTDGRMETTYRLKPNLTWHDGRPLTADDFVFAYRVYTAPGIAAFVARPQDQIEEILTSDARTLVIHWRNLYPDAGTIVTDDLDALPRHILEGTLNAYLQDPTNQDTLMSSPYWTTQYVGLGPFKLDRWEPGSSIEGTAFDGHVLGRPKIDRIVVKPIQDENTAMTNLLAGAADLATDNALRFEHAMELKRQWDPGQRGVALLRPGTRHHIIVQFRPDLLKAPALADLRVRRALMHAIDRQSLNEAIFEGQGLIVEHFVPREMPYYNEVERAITRYPFDSQRTTQLMVEAGYTRDASGFFANTAGERFRPHVQSDGAAQFEREMNLIQDTWGRIGIEIEPYMLPAAQVRNNEPRNTFPALYTTSTGVRESALNIFAANEIGTPANRWAGNNRGGWSNPDFERWWGAFNTTLDRSERNRQVVELSQVVSDQIPSMPLYFNISPIGHVAALRGPGMGTPESLAFWNLHEWELR